VCDEDDADDTTKVKPLRVLHPLPSAIPLLPFSHPLICLIFNLLFVPLRTDYQYNPRGSMASVKKKILITHNLRMLKIKTKEYGKGQTLHNFMLEEVRQQRLYT
jgi:hypothetical protein